MNNLWVCPHCGGNTNRFSASRGYIVCGTCGTEVLTETEQNADLDFQRNMALAKQHLSVGNWDDAKRIVKPYLASKPAEKQVYLYLLIATTKCFEDLLLDNSIASKEAADYWIKLENLGFVNSAMVNYAERRAAQIRTRENEIIVKKIILISVNLFLTVITYFMIICGEGFSLVMLILTIVCWIHTKKRIRFMKERDPLSNRN